MNFDKLKKAILDVTKFSLLIFGVLWAIANVITLFVPYDQIVQVSSSYLQTDSKFLSTSTTAQSNNIPETVFYNSFKVFSIISIFMVIGSLIFLSRGRSLFEIVWIFNGFVIPREKKYWGIIADITNHAPIPLASIELMKIVDGKEELVSRTVADTDGRYRLSLPPMDGKYIMVVKADGYDKKMRAIDKFDATVLNNGEITDDILLTRVESMSVYIQGLYYYLKPKFYTLLIINLYIFSIIGLLFLTYGLIKLPGIDSDIGFAIYAGAVLWNTIIIFERKNTNFGRIVDEDNNPIEKAFITIFKDARELGTFLTDQSGSVKIDLEPGDYMAKAYRQDYEMITKASNQELIPVKVSDYGYLTKNIVLRKIGEQKVDEKLTSSQLMNPFN